jgi:putative tricarboxylic transport membrane protein
MTLHRDSIAALAILAMVGAAWVQIAQVAQAAAMFPQMILGAVGILAAIMFVQGMRRARPEQPFISHARNLALALGLTLIYIIAVGPVGYFPATLVFLPLLAYGIGARGWLVPVVTLGFTVTVWLVFVFAFGRRLPSGTLFDN